MRDSRKWTEQEVQVLIERYSIDGSDVLATELNRSKQSIMRKAQNIGLRTNVITTSRERQLNALHIKTREDARLKRLMQDPETRERQRQIYTRNNQKRRARFREQRSCIKCGKPSIEHSTQYCLFHWANVIGNTCKRYDKVFAQQLLDKLEAQEYRCAISGVKLIPGYNASIDHIVPRSKGGLLDDLDNLWWVTMDVNFAKRQMLTDEFVEFCKMIVDYNANRQ